MAAALFRTSSRPSWIVVLALLWTACSGYSNPLPNLFGPEGDALAPQTGSMLVHVGRDGSVPDPVITAEVPLDTPIPFARPGQESAPLAAHGAGVHLVVWRGGSGLEFSRTRALDGVLLDPDAVPIPGSNGDPSGVDVAFDGSRFWVVWARSDYQGLMAVRIRPEDGVVLDQPPITVSTRRTDNRSTVSVACKSSNCLVAWPDSSQGLVLRAVRLRTSDGMVLDSTPIGLSIYSRDAQPAVASDGNKYLVTWLSNQDSTTSLDGALISETSESTVHVTYLDINSTDHSGMQTRVSFVGTNFLVTWSQQRVGAADIYAARVNPITGAVLDNPTIPVVSNIQVNSRFTVATIHAQLLIAWADGYGACNVLGTRVGDDAQALDPWPVRLAVISNDWSPVTLASGGNSYLLAWATSTVSGVFGNILGLRLDGTDLHPLEPSPLLLSMAILRETAPAVAALANTALTVWLEDRAGNYVGNIAGVRVDGLTGAVLEPQPLSIVRQIMNNGVPAVAAGENLFLVAWQHSVFAGSPDLMVARVRAVDGMLLDPQGVQLTTDAQSEYQPSVAYDGTHFLVVYRTWENVLGRRIRVSNGVTVDGPVIQIAKMPTNVTAGPLAVAFCDGNYLVAWKAGEPTTTADVMGVRVRASDAAVLDAIPLLLARGVGPNNRVAMESVQGHFLLAWQDARTSPPQVRAARVRSVDGVVVDGEGFALGPDPSVQAFPAVASDGHSFLAAWRSHSDGADQIKAVRLTADGVVMDPSPFLISDVTASAAGTTPPALVATGHGRYLVIYEAFDPTLHQLRMQARMVLDRVDGTPCTLAEECAGAACVDGFCCDTECGGGTPTDCQACSVQAGGPVNGVCSVIPAAARITCRPAGDCDLPEVCDGTQTTCPPNLTQEDDSPCNDNNPCTELDLCREGQCTGFQPRVCVELDVCHEAGTCLPESGECTNPPREEGSWCPLGACHQGTCLPIPDGGAQADAGTSNHDAATPDGANPSTQPDGGVADATVPADASMTEPDAALSPIQPDASVADATVPDAGEPSKDASITVDAGTSVHTRDASSADAAILDSAVPIQTPDASVAGRDAATPARDGGYLDATPRDGSVVADAATTSDGPWLVDAGGGSAVVGSDSGASPGSGCSCTADGTQPNPLPLALLALWFMRGRRR